MKVNSYYGRGAGSNNPLSTVVSSPPPEMVGAEFLHATSKSNYNTNGRDGATKLDASISTLEVLVASRSFDVTTNADGSRDGVSTLENPSMPTVDSYDRDLRTVSVSLSSREPDTATNTTWVSSSTSYGSFGGCCGCGCGDADADASSDDEVDDDDDDEADRIHQDDDDDDKRSMEYHTVSVGSFTEQAALHSNTSIGTDDSETTLSAARTEVLVGCTNLVWDDDRDEVETQQLSKAEVMTRIGGNNNNSNRRGDIMASEHTVDESHGPSVASTVDRHSLLRNILFKKTLVRVSDPKRVVPQGHTTFAGCNDQPAEVGNEKASFVNTERPNSLEHLATNEHLTTDLLGAQSTVPVDTEHHGSCDNAAKFGMLSLLFSLLPVGDDHVAAPREELPSSEPFRGATAGEQNPPQADAVTSAATTGVLSDVAVSNAATAGGVPKAMERSKGTTQALRHRKPAALQVGKIGNRIDNAKAKSEERRKIKKMEQLQTVEQHLRAKRKGTRKARDPLKMKLSSKSQSPVPIRSVRTRNQQCLKKSLNTSHLPTFGASDVIDTIFGDAWQNSDEAENKKRSRRSSSVHRSSSRDRSSSLHRSKRSDTMRIHTDFARRSMSRSGSPMSHQRHPSLPSPICGAGPVFLNKRNGRDLNQHYYITRTKRGELILHSSPICEKHDYPRRRLLRPTMTVAPLCGTGLAFAALEDDTELTNPVPRSRTRSSNSRRTRSEERHRSDQRESHLQKCTWRQRLFFNKKQTEPLVRPIPGTLPTKKSTCHI